MKFKFRRYYLYYLGRTAAFVFSLLPLWAGRRVGRFLGLMAFFILARYRRVTIANLERVFGQERQAREIRRLSMRVFENLGENAAELINFPKINAGNIDRFVEIRGRDILDKALERGAGVIVVTGHFGNWELLAVTVLLKGYKGVVVGRKLYFDKYDRYLNSLRKLKDVDIIYRDDSPRKILKALKMNKIVGIVADQDVDSVEGVFVDFFGRSAYTPAGPAALAKVSGAALIPMFMVRQGARHTLRIEEPIGLVDTGDKAKDLIANTQAWSTVIESYIRRYPDHWVWMHRRWKTQPNAGTVS